MMTNSQSSASMGGATSPVKAPFSSKCMFCAPTWMPEPSRRSLQARRYGKGGHSTTSTPETPATLSRTPWVRLRASSRVVCIFQLPATMGVGTAASLCVGRG